ncbi:Putative transposase (Fragment) [Bradyrhizobium sp. ORS 278]
MSRLCGRDRRPVEAADRGDWLYLWIDATYAKLCQNGRIVSVGVIITAGVNSDGRSGMLGMDICSSETETFLAAFLHQFAWRGLHESSTSSLTHMKGSRRESRRFSTRPGCADTCAGCERPGACQQERAARRLGLHRHGDCPIRCRSYKYAMAAHRRSVGPQIAEAGGVPR